MQIMLPPAPGALGVKAKAICRIVAMEWVSLIVRRAANPTQARSTLGLIGVFEGSGVALSINVAPSPRPGRRSYSRAREHL